jgi:hypothetical protein
MLDIERNRRARKYSSSEMIRRALWTLTRPLFSVQSEALFRMAAIFTAMFRREN